MNIITFSDLHIGNKYIDQEVLDNLILDIKTLLKPDSVIIFCGDLFHKKFSVDSEEARQAIQLCKELDKLNVSIYIVNGTYSHDYNYIDTFKKLELINFHFIQTLSEIEVKNNINETLHTLIIPEEYIEDQQDYYKSTVYNKKKVYDLVVMHGTFIDVLFHNLSIESEILRKAPKFDSKDFSRHTLTLSGHIHRHQCLGKKKNVIYVGSYGNMNFGHDASNVIHSIDIDKANKSFVLNTTLNIKSHTFEDITIDESNIDTFESNLLPYIRNKSNRHHIRVRCKVDDNLIISTLKELKKNNSIKSLLIENKDTIIDNNVELKENENEIDYSEIYSGPIEEQIKTYIKEHYNVDMDIENIKAMIS